MSWYALFHSPGPALPPGVSVFSHPAIGDHFAFLQSLKDRGLLVAAGPLDASGNGMTIVRVDDDLDVTALATTEDRAVAAGYLTVDVRPWDVRIVG